MATKHFIHRHFNLILICLGVFVITVLSTACNNSNETSNVVGRLKPGNWVSLDIKFQPNTDEERRDKSIKAIERMLLNSVTPLMKEYKDYYPSMRVTWTPTTDTLHYWIDVINTYGMGTKPTMYALSSGPDQPTCPPCPTTNPCRICDSLKRYDGATFGIADISIDTSNIVITK
jgi:hypothetical protein